jgi:hypothetical protein
VIVLAKLIGVAAQLVDDPLFRRRRVPAAAGDVDVLLVVHDPDFGALGLLGAVLRHDLQEAAKGPVLLIDLVIELAVDAQRLGELDGAHRRLPRCVAGHHVGRRRRRRAIDGDGRLCVRAGRETKNEREKERDPSGTDHGVSPRISHFSEGPGSP